MLVDLVALLFNFVDGCTRSQHKQNMENLSLYLFAKDRAKGLMSFRAFKEKIPVVCWDPALKNAKLDDTKQQILKQQTKFLWIYWLKPGFY